MVKTIQHIMIERLSKQKPQEASKNSQSIQVPNLIKQGALDKATSKKQKKDMNNENNRLITHRKILPLGVKNLAKKDKKTKLINGNIIKNKNMLLSFNQIDLFNGYGSFQSIINY